MYQHYIIKLAVHIYQYFTNLYKSENLTNGNIQVWGEATSFVPQLMDGQTNDRQIRKQCCSQTSFSCGLLIYFSGVVQQTCSYVQLWDHHCRCTIWGKSVLGSTVFFAQNAGRSLLVLGKPSQHRPLLLQHCMKRQHISRCT